MNNATWFEKMVRPTYPVAEAITWGDVCVLNSDGKLVKWTSSASGVAALFFALDNADPTDPDKDRVAVIVGGISPSTILCNAVAGTYSPGQPVYASADGKVAASGSTRVVGVYLDGPVTLEAEGKLHVAPMYVQKTA